MAAVDVDAGLDGQGDALDVGGVDGAELVEVDVDVVAALQRERVEAGRHGHHVGGGAAQHDVEGLVEGAVVADESGAGVDFQAVLAFNRDGGGDAVVGVDGLAVDEAGSRHVVQREGQRRLAATVVGEDVLKWRRGHRQIHQRVGRKAEGGGVVQTDDRG